MKTFLLQLFVLEELEPILRTLSKYIARCLAYSVVFLCLKCLSQLQKSIVRSVIDTKILAPVGWFILRSCQLVFRFIVSLLCGSNNKKVCYKWSVTYCIRLLFRSPALGSRVTYDFTLILSLIRTWVLLSALWGTIYCKDSDFCMKLWPCALN